MATDIIITATFDVDPEKIDDLMKRCKPLIDGALTEEGCQDYSWTLDPYVPGRIWVMERWESEESSKNILKMIGIKIWVLHLTKLVY